MRKEATTSSDQWSIEQDALSFSYVFLLQDCDCDRDRDRCCNNLGESQEGLLVYKKQGLLVCCLFGCYCLDYFSSLFTWRGSSEDTYVFGRERKCLFIKVARLARIMSNNY